MTAFVFGVLMTVLVIKYPKQIWEGLKTGWKAIPTLPQCGPTSTTVQSDKLMSHFQSGCSNHSDCHTQFCPYCGKKVTHS